MADPRGTEGPFFYRGLFHYPSVPSRLLDVEQRRQMRAVYRSLYRFMKMLNPDDARRARIEARKTFRPILYPKVGMRNLR